MHSLFEDGIAQQIITRIEQLTPSSQPKWGKMNVSQMLRHVNMALKTGTGEITINPPFFLKLLAPIIKRKVLEKAPYKPGLPTAKEFITHTSSVDFEKEKKNLLATLQKFVAAGEAGVNGRKHPVFGKMTPYEWGFSQWKHFNHHLSQFGV